MRLKQYPYSLTDAKTGKRIQRTAGEWRSADGLWRFVLSEIDHGWLTRPEGQLQVTWESRRDLLQHVGLADLPFPTRKAAVAALELALAGLPADHPAFSA